MSASRLPDLTSFRPATREDLGSGHKAVIVVAGGEAGGMRRFLAATAMAVLTACGAADDADAPVAQRTETATPTTEATTATTVATECLTVSASFRSELGVQQVAAVRESIETGPGLANKGVVWFLATPTGATWVTNIDATGPYGGGLILPLNDLARRTSDLGTAAQPGAPAFAGITESHPGAEQAWVCARS